jgi:hypothetical protein
MVIVNFPDPFCGISFAAPDSRETGNQGHAQIPSPINDAKIGKVFHGNVS